MSTDFTVVAKSNPSKYVDNVSKGDVVTYTFDFTPWQEDNSEISSVEWKIEAGQAAILSSTLDDGVTTAVVQFNEKGQVLLSITAITPIERKKMWLEISTRDRQLSFFDYWDVQYV